MLPSVFVRLWIVFLSQDHRENNGNADGEAGAIIGVAVMTEFPSFTIDD